MAGPLLIADLSGGRNGIDNPADPAFPRTQCVEALNVDFARSKLGRKRPGTVAIGITGGTAFTSQVLVLIRHVPSGNGTAAELWAVDGAATPLVKRLTGGSTWADVTLADAVQSDVTQITGVSFNGKLYLFYNSAVNRLHVWDPSLGTPQVRRVGINPGTTAATVANTGAGAYAAVLRYYRIRFIQRDGNIVVRRSEPTSSVSFTPSGAGTAARITRPTAPSEQETHWEVEVSLDNATWYTLVGEYTLVASGSVAIATTTYDDSIATGTYATYTPGHTSGLYQRPNSAKFGLTDGNRLIYAGTYESGASDTPQGSRIWFTPVLGTADSGDDERYINTSTQKGYLDLNEKDGGDLTGLGGPINGVVWAFKRKSVWRLTPTGDNLTPYLPRRVSGTVGSINHKSIVLGEDAQGLPAIYFLSDEGPYRVGANGIEYLGRDIEDQWLGLGGLSAVNVGSMYFHGMFHQQLKQVWWWWPLGASETPTVKMVLDVRHATMRDQYGVRGGWSRHTGDSATALCSALFSNTLGASMSLDLKPHIGLAISGAPEIHKCDTADTSDDGVAFQSYLKTRSIAPGSLGTRFGIQESLLLAKAQSGVTIRQTIDRDFGAETVTADVTLTADGSETTVIKKFGASMQSDLGVAQIQLGDSAAVAATWQLEQLLIPAIPEGVK